jgi:hypothetical protein
MIVTLMAGFGILLFSGFANSYISYLLLEKTLPSNGKNNF